MIFPETIRSLKDLILRSLTADKENNGWIETKTYSDFNESNANPGSDNGYYRTSMDYSNRENFETLFSFSKKFGDFSVNANAGSDFFRLFQNPISILPLTD